MQLRWFFSTFIAFFSDFVHFTLKLFKILYYLCTAIQNHRTLIALSSRYHRTHVHVLSTSAHGVSCRCKSSFKIMNNEQSSISQRASSILKILFEYDEKFCLILRNRPKAVVLYKNPNKSILFFSFYSPLRGLFLTLSSPHLAVIYQADMEGIDYGYCSW